MTARDPRRRIQDNPFYVLGLAPDADRVEVEREGRKLMGMLEIGLSSAGTYTSPLGQHERTIDKVREAMAELRDPERRLRHELWARLSPQRLTGTDPDPHTQRRVRAGWAGAGRLLGWRRT